jgi:hypothetical protein
MNLANYLIAEAAGPLDPSRPLVLTILADLKTDGNYYFGSDQQDLAKAEAEFIEQSNRSISDDGRDNDVPAVFFRLGYEEFSAFHQRVIRIRGLGSRNPVATVTLGGYAEQSEIILASGLGRDFRVSPAANQVGPGWFQVNLTVRGSEEEDGFVLLTPPVTSRVPLRILSIRVTRHSPEK